MAASPLSLWCLLILLYSRNIAQHNPGSTAGIPEGVLKGLVELVKGSPLVASATVWFLLHTVKHKSFSHKDLLSVGNIAVVHCWRQLPVAVQRLELLPHCRKLFSPHLVVFREHKGRQPRQLSSEVVHVFFFASWECNRWQQTSRSCPIKLSRSSCFCFVHAFIWFSVTFVRLSDWLWSIWLQGRVFFHPPRHRWAVWVNKPIPDAERLGFRGWWMGLLQNVIQLSLSIAAFPSMYEKKKCRANWLLHSHYLQMKEFL